MNWIEPKTGVERPQTVRSEQNYVSAVKKATQDLAEVEKKW